jgi:hypothetical protein
MLSGSTLTGTILCRDFFNSDEDGIGSYDLAISRLRCKL